MSAEVELSKRGDDGLTTRLVALVVTVAVLVTGAIAFRRHDPASVATALAPQAADDDDPVTGELAYSCQQPDASYDLCLIPAAGGTPIQLTDTPGVNELHPSWSPEGRRLVYTRSVVGGGGISPYFAPSNGRIWVVDVTDPQHPEPTSLDLDGFKPDWGPGTAEYRFDAAVGPGAEVENVSWSFPDGTVLKGERRRHSFPRGVTSGSYTAKVTTTDDLTTSVRQTFVLPAVQPPAIGFDIESVFGQPARRVLRATGDVPAGAVVSWDAGDGTGVVEGPVLQHDYASAGVYTATLRLTVAGIVQTEYEIDIDVTDGLLSHVTADPTIDVDEVGSQILFSFYSEPDRFDTRAPIRIKRVNADGSDPGELTQWTHMRLMDVSWRPDGKREAHSEFLSRAIDSPYPPLARIRSQSPKVDEGVEQWMNVTPEEIQGPEAAIEPDFAPDGRRLVFVRCSTIGPYANCSRPSRQLWIMDTDGSFQATETRAVVGDDSGPSDPEWSPDGGWIAYWVTSPHGLRLVRPDGSGEPREVPGSGDSALFPSWRPRRAGADAADPAVEAHAEEFGGLVQSFFLYGDDVYAKIGLDQIDALDPDKVRVCVIPAGSDRACGNDPVKIPGVPTPPASLTDPLSGNLKSFGEAVVEKEGFGSLVEAAQQVTGQSGAPDLRPGRYQLVIEYIEDVSLGGDEILGIELSDPFKVGCEGSCFTGWLVSAAAFDALASSLESMCYAYSAFKLAQLSLTILAAVVGGATAGAAGIAAGFVIGAVASSIIGFSVSALTNWGVNKVLESRLAEARWDLSKRAEQSGSTEFDDAIKQIDSLQDSGFGSWVKGMFDPLDLTCSYVPGMLRNLAQAMRELQNSSAPAGKSAGLWFAAPASVDPDEIVPLEIPQWTEPPADARERQAMAGTSIGAIVPQLLDALDRYQAAQLLGDEQLAAAHLATVTAAADNLRALTSVLEQSANDLMSQMPAEIANTPIATVDDVTALDVLQARVATDGLTDLEREQLLGVGFTEADLETITQNLAGYEIPDAVIGLTHAEVQDQFLALAEQSRTAFTQLAADAGAAAATLWDGPQASDSSVVTRREAAVDVTLDAFDPQLDEIEYAIVGGPEHGTITGTAPDLVYVPDAGYIGPDAIVWTASDGDNTSYPLTVTIDVALDPPIGEPDDFGVRQGSVLEVPAPGVLGNDSSPFLPTVAIVDSGPTRGNLALRSDGSFTFEAPQSGTGSVTFTYRTSYPSSAWSDPVTVTIDIVDVADPPSAVTDRLEVQEDQSGVIAPAANDSDLDGDTVTFVGYTQPVAGRVACDLAGTCTYTPNANFHGTDAWRYTITDGTGRRTEGRVEVVVVPVDDGPIATRDRLSFEKGASASIDVIANDTHPDGVALTFVGNTATTNGAVACNSSGVCAYTPADANVVGDAFSYTIRDDDGDESTAVVEVAAFGAFQEIESSGPLLFIDTGSSLSCGLEYEGDDLGSFFADFGCGTFLATGGTLFGPQQVSGSGNPPQPRTTFTRVSQGPVEGSGTAGAPYVIRTLVGAGATGLSVEQLDSYVQGEESYRTDLTVRNDAAAPRSFVLWRAGDCQLADDDTGFGRLTVETGGVACVAEGGRTIEWVPIGAGSSGLEAAADDVWAMIASQQPFDGTCRCDENIDNGAGLSWTGTLQPGQSVSFAHLTAVSPQGRRVVLGDIALAAPSVAVSSSVDATVSLRNSDPANAVTVHELSVVLPSGFAVVPGSTTGAILTDPAIVGDHLTWSSPIVLPPGGTASVTFGVRVADAAGTFALGLGVDASPASVIIGPPATIDVTANRPPLPRIAAATALLVADVDGSESFDFDGTIVTHDWNFGDGTTATGQAVEHHYAAPGTYEISLRVVDDDGASATTRDFVEIVGTNAPPVAIGSATAGPRGQRVGLAAAAAASTITGTRTVSFDGTLSTDPDGEVVAWSWDFGDGTNGSGRTVTHTYADDGTYVVVLHVLDDRGAASTTSFEITVELGNEPPVADFVVDTASLAAAFDGSQSFDPDGELRPSAFAWDFGDGTSGTGMQPVHDYASGGSYEVTLRVTDDDGATDSHTRSVVVGASANVAPVADGVAVVDGLTVDFDGSGSTDADGEIVAFEWVVDGETPIDGATTSITYPAPGTYSAQLTVLDDDGAVDTVSLQVEVDDEPDDTTTTSTSSTTTSSTTTTTIDPDSTSSTTTTTTIDPDSTSSTTTSTTIDPDSTSSTTSTTSTTTSTTSTTSTTTSSSTTTTTLAPTTSSSTTSASTTSTTATPSVVTFGPTTSVGEVGAPTSTPPPTISGGLPKTGSNSGRSLELVLLLLAAGLGLVLVSRRPKRS